MSKTKTLLRVFVLKNGDAKAERARKLHVVERTLSAVVDVAIKQGVLKARARGRAVLFVWGHGMELVNDADLADAANDLTICVEAEGKPYAGPKMLTSWDVRQPRPAKKEPYPFMRRGMDTATLAVTSSVTPAENPLGRAAEDTPLPAFSEHARSQMHMRGISESEANDAYVCGTRRRHGASASYKRAGVVVITSADMRTVLTCYRQSPSDSTDYSITPCKYPGIIIGREGCVVRAIRRKTRTLITVLQDAYGKGQHAIQICGLPHKLKVAEQLVDRLLDEKSREETRAWLLADLIDQNYQLVPSWYADSGLLFDSSELNLELDDSELRAVRLQTPNKLKLSTTR